MRALAGISLLIGLAIALAGCTGSTVQDGRGELVEHLGGNRYRIVNATDTSRMSIPATLAEWVRPIAELAKAKGQTHYRSISDQLAFDRRGRSARIDVVELGSPSSTELQKEDHGWLDPQAIFAHYRRQAR